MRGAVVKPERVQVNAEVEAAYGQRSATAVGAEFGLSRNAVIGIWNRGRAAGRIVEMTAREINAAKREAAPPVTVAEPVEPEQEPAPAPVEPPSAPAPTPKKVCPVPPVKLLPIAPALPRPTVVLAHLSGAAAAYRDADPDGRRTCRWPHGDPRDADFRFCGEVVTTPTVRGNDGHARVQPYCEACRERAQGRNQAARSTAPMLGHSAHAGPRAVKAGGLRFGRAG